MIDIRHYCRKWDQLRLQELGLKALAPCRIEAVARAVILLVEEDFKHVKLAYHWACSSEAVINNGRRAVEKMIKWKREPVRKSAGGAGIIIH